MNVTKSKPKQTTSKVAATDVPKKGKATILSQKVAEVLMQLRQSRQMSQRAFAEHIGVSFQQYQKYEKGRDRLSLEKAMLLCTQLDLPLDVFMDDGQHESESFGFAETEQASFGSKPADHAAASLGETAAKLGKNEKEILEIFAQIPATSRDDFLETLRQLAKMTAKKS